jgi:hypothetical protein
MQNSFANRGIFHETFKNNNSSRKNCFDEKFVVKGKGDSLKDSRKNEKIAKEPSRI